MIYSFYILNKTANARIFYHDCVKLQEEKMLKFHFFLRFFCPRQFFTFEEECGRVVSDCNIVHIKEIKVEKLGKKYT